MKEKSSSEEELQRKKIWDTNKLSAPAHPADGKLGIAGLNLLEIAFHT